MHIYAHINHLKKLKKQIRKVLVTTGTVFFSTAVGVRIATADVGGKATVVWATTVTRSIAATRTLVIVVVSFRLLAVFHFLLAIFHLLMTTIATTKIVVTTTIGTTKMLMVMMT